MASPAVPGPTLLRPLPILAVHSLLPLGSCCSPPPPYQVHPHTHLLSGKFAFFSMSSSLFPSSSAPLPNPAQPPKESLPPPLAPLVVGEPLCCNFITGSFCVGPPLGCNPLKVRETIAFTVLSAQHSRLPGA